MSKILEFVSSLIKFGLILGLIWFLTSLGKNGEAKFFIFIIVSMLIYMIWYFTTTTSEEQEEHLKQIQRGERL